jgi:hypothetical protein
MEANQITTKVPVLPNMRFRTQVAWHGDIQADCMYIVVMMQQCAQY